MADADKTAPQFDRARLDQVWRRLHKADAAGLAKARDELGCNFPLESEGYEEDEAFIYLPVTTLTRAGDEVRQETIRFAIGDGVLVTLEPEGGFAAFDRAVQQLRRRPGLAQSAHGVMLILLQGMNSAANQIVELASAALEGMNDQIGRIIEGVDERGREIGVSDIGEAMAALNDKEELVSRIQESQLLIERAARYLRNEINGAESDMRIAVESLISDVQSVKEHAGFEHDKLRYLQNSVMTSLNVKQNQIVKVFTIITAVFLPPTLVATFYGMNFAVMPELAWKHGFLATILLTLLSALLPLLYIKQKGWLR
jgi:magnesium transporter